MSSNEIILCYKELRQLQPLSFQGAAYRKLKNAITACDLDSKTAERELLRALKTCVVLSSEIGMSFEGIHACLIAPFLKSEPQIEAAKKVFGPQVATILEGIIGINNLYERNNSIESENFRNLLISFAKDMRVILIMIADSVNMMRTFSRLCSDDKTGIDAEEFELYPPSMIESVASEASYLYAPLAHKLGLYKIKSELEDISLKILNHDAYYHIKGKLNATKDVRDRYIENFIGPIKKRLEEQNLKFHIKGRTKSIYSIWQKMRKQRCEFEGVYDLFAIRIILDSPLAKEKLQCWQTYSVVTDMYQPNPHRLRDWLSIPKSNGYESLHITVLGPENKWVEVQIRTERMDDVAEHGLAAHWRYKGVKMGQKGVEAWLASIRSALEVEGGAMKMMDQFKTDIESDEIYVFTPKGDIFKLIAGATILDFAYSIHTSIGDHCTGAIVNNKNASIRQVLHSGDQVNILTSQQQVPKRSWLDFVQTGRAKTKIRQSLNEMETKAASLAKEILERKFRNRKIDFNLNHLNTVIKRLKYKDVNEFYQRVVDDDVNINLIIEDYLQLLRRENGDFEQSQPLHKADEFVLENEAANSRSQDDELVIDGSLKGIDYTLAKCCSPIYGDEIFGFVTINSGIRIHRTSCPNAAALRSKCGYRIVKARWAGEGSHSDYSVTLRIVGNDDLGVVNNITSIISKEAKVNIRSFNIRSRDGLFEGELSLVINDKLQLDGLIKKLSSVKGVKNIHR